MFILCSCCLLRKQHLIVSSTLYLHWHECVLSSILCSNHKFNTPPVNSINWTVWFFSRAFVCKHTIQARPLSAFKFVIVLRWRYRHWFLFSGWVNTSKSAYSIPCLLHPRIKYRTAWSQLVGNLKSGGQICGKLQCSIMLRKALIEKFTLLLASSSVKFGLRRCVRWTYLGVSG